MRKRIFLVFECSFNDDSLLYHFSKGGSLKLYKFILNHKTYLTYDIFFYVTNTPNFKNW